MASYAPELNLIDPKATRYADSALTVFLLEVISQYSCEVQQPIRPTAVLGGHHQTRWAAPFDREQGRAGGLHPEGQGFESP